MKTRKIYNQCVKKILSKDILIQLKSQVNGQFKFLGKQVIKMPKKVNILHSKTMKENKIILSDLFRF